MNTEVKYITPDIAARRLDVSRETICRLIRKGELGALRIGKQYRIPESEWQKYLTSVLVESEN